MHPLDADDGPALLRHADVAAEQAKRTHVGVCAYDGALDRHSTERLGLLADLARAIAEGELVLHYQPKCDLSGRVLGVEALVRWAHPQRGLLPPAEFVQVAERTGLVHPLTESVLDQALAQVRRWLDDGRELPVAVNISTRSLLQPGVAERALTALGANGVPARLLGLEITETTIMEDPERALEVLTQLADAGIRLSIDDFGTGYSSLAYLKALPVHELKIDRVFGTSRARDTRPRATLQPPARSVCVWRPAAPAPPISSRPWPTRRWTRSRSWRSPGRCPVRRSAPMPSRRQTSAGSPCR